MKIAVLGAGCVGSVLAEHFYNTGYKENLRIIATGDRAEKLEENGIIVNEKKYFIPVMEIAEKKPELVFLCVKNYDLEKACKDLEKFIDENTILLPLLNSVSPTPTLQKRFPMNRVLYGYITKIDAYRKNGKFYYNIPGDIHFGYANNSGIKPEIMKIKNVLQEAAFPTYVDTDMVRGVWKKWMLNVGANQVSALTEADYLKFAKIPEIEEILRLAMQELLTIACYEKVNLSTQDIIDTVTYLTTYVYPKQTSMLQDVLAHRKTEIDYISGDIIKFSRKWNYPCPVNLTMYYLIKSKEKAYLMDKECINGE